MELGVFLPISGSATGPDTLAEAAQTAEAQGFDAVWSADRVVTPWKIETPTPTARTSVHRAAGEALPRLAHLSGVSRGRAPRRSRSASACWCCPIAIRSTGRASPPPSNGSRKGRLITGRGRRLDGGGVRRARRALPRTRTHDRRATRGLTLLWRDEHISYHGQALPVRRCRVLSEADPAAAYAGLGRRRGRGGPAAHGALWRRLVPLLRRTTPAELRAGFDDARAQAESFGRDPDMVQLTCCRPIEVTSRASRAGRRGVARLAGATGRGAAGYQ